MAKSDILLESGTNEVEIIEFFLGGQSFGVNVSKVREILTYNPASVTSVPEAYHSVMGMFILRDSTITLIDLASHLGVKHDATAADHKVVMVCSFNDMVNGFLVDGISQIHRCSWESIIPLPHYIAVCRPSITSSVTINKKTILLVDLEHILADIYPQTKMVYHEEEDKLRPVNMEERKHDREAKKIILAEDSPIVRAKVVKITMDVGYTNVTAFDNGREAYELVEQYAQQAKNANRPITDFVDVVLTDIEMPQMDGLTVCRKIKQDLNLTGLPVIVFSSLINEQMIHKCRSVGADTWCNKLEIADLVHTLDNILFEGGNKKRL